MRHPFHRFTFLGHVGRWLSFFRRLTPVAGPFWSSSDRLRIRTMTVALIFLTGLQIAIATSINLWIENLFDSLETRDTDRFLLLVGAAVLIVLANIVVTIAHLTVKRWLQIGWREWLTHRLLGEWMTSGSHYKVTLIPGDHTNPDGRIAEDVRLTTENAIELGHSLLYATLILISFATILWGLSGAVVVGSGHISFSVPGHLVWIAVLYAAIGTIVALRLGLPLIRAQNLRQTTEADFRFGLARARENSLQVALLRGEASENHTLRAIFRKAVRSWNLQTRALVNLFYFSSTWWVLSQVFPILVASPRYLAGTITLGVLMQTAQAFQQVVGAMSWPVDNVSRVAEWRASAERVLNLHDAIGTVTEVEQSGSGSTIRVETTSEPKLVFDRLVLMAYDGTPIMQPLSIEVRTGERVWIPVDSTLGFRLLKALAQLWPWGQGRVVLPGNGPLFLSSGRPYLPRGRLRDILAYPGSSEELSDSAVIQALTDIGLGPLVGDLDRPKPWNDILSEDEQHMIGLVRILLSRPQWIVLHETLDTLAPDARAAMMRLLLRECPEATVVILGQNPGIEGFAVHRVAAIRGPAVSRDAGNT
jgi:putative ATP-binding cassette transporter